MYGDDGYTHSRMWAPCGPGICFILDSFVLCGTWNRDRHMGGPQSMIFEGFTNDELMQVRIKHVRNTVEKKTWNTKVSSRGSPVGLKKNERKKSIISETKKKTKPIRQSKTNKQKLLRFCKVSIMRRLDKWIKDCDLEKTILSHKNVLI